MMKYIEILVSGQSSDINEVLIAELAEIGFESFDDNQGVLKAYIKEHELDNELLREVSEKYRINTKRTEIEQQNWNQQWEDSFEPVKIGSFCTIRADFHAADNSVEHDIIITPKMSFGTGHHATTKMMVERMSELDFPGKTVLDFGTGTGVLAILAARLGAIDILAIDNDEWSVENTLENIERNNISDIEVMKGSLELATAKYNFILANINRHILLQYMNDMVTLLKPGGQILMSGILDEDEKLINDVAIKAGLTSLNKKQIDKWVCLSYLQS